MTTKTNRTARLSFVAILCLVFAGAVHADFDTAMSNFKAGKYVEAAADFQALVDQSPEYDSGYFMLAQCFVKMGKLDDAEKNFQKAIEIAGDKFEYHFGLANGYYRAKKYSRAVGTLKTAEALAPDNYKMHLFKLRGLSYIGLEKWADAIEDLEKAQGIKKSPAVTDQLGVAYYNLGHYDKAVPFLKASLANSSNEAATLGRLTNALLGLGAEASNASVKDRNYHEALKYAEQYQKLKPSDYEATNLVGRAALGANEYAKAEQALVRVTEQKPDYCYAFVNLGKVYIVQKRWQEAETTLKRAETCAPRMAVIYENLGFVSQTQKRLPEAIAYYEKALAIKPSSAIEGYIATCRKNLEIAAENAEISAEEQRMEDEARKAQEEYEAAKAKEEEWKRKRERDN